MTDIPQPRRVLATTLLLIMLIMLPACATTARIADAPHLTTADKIATAAALSPPATPGAQTMSMPPPQLNPTSGPASGGAIPPPVTAPRDGTPGPLAGSVAGPVGTVASGNASPTPTTMRDRVLGAQATLRTGHFVATIDYRNGTRAETAVTFDLGSGMGLPRLHTVTNYRGATGWATPDERVTIGPRSWKRAVDGGWSELGTPEEVRDVLVPLLPNLAAVPNQVVTPAGGGGTLAWYDPSRGTDVTLEVDQATGIPRRLRLVPRTLDLVLDTVYATWNGPIVIPDPVQP